LLLAVAEPPERFSVRLEWSRFRRHHQAVAKTCHSRRRVRQQAPDLGGPHIQQVKGSDLALTEECWKRIVALLPPEKPAIGRPNKDHRTMLAGMFWVIRTGSSWRDLPDEFGPWETVRGRYDRWRKAGIWQQILDTLKQDHSHHAP
jgi:transposase